jgi:hypothetical protein
MNRPEQQPSMKPSMLHLLDKEPPPGSANVGIKPRWIIVASPRPDPGQVKTKIENRKSLRAGTRFYQIYQITARFYSSQAAGRMQPWLTTRRLHHSPLKRKLTID